MGINFKPVSALDPLMDPLDIPLLLDGRAHRIQRQILEMWYSSDLICIRMRSCKVGRTLCVIQGGGLWLGVIP